MIKGKGVTQVRWEGRMNRGSRRISLAGSTTRLGNEFARFHSRSLGRLIYLEGCEGRGKNGGRG